MPTSHEVFQCIVCYDDLRSSHENVVTDCGHVFHKECLLRASATRNRCPFCQKFDVQFVRLYFPCTEEHQDLREELKAKEDAEKRLSEELAEAKNTIGRLEAEKQSQAKDNIDFVRKLLEEMIERGETARERELAYNAFLEFHSVCREVYSE